jgi:hypothetical protein
LLLITKTQRCLSSWLSYANVLVDPAIYGISDGLRPKFLRLLMKI